MRSRLVGFTALIVLSGCTASEKPNLSPTSIESFGNFRPPAEPAHFLACPQNYCAVKPDMVTKLKDIPAEKLMKIARAALDSQPGVALVSSANEGLRLVYHQIGGWGSQGATLTLDIIDADEGVSGVALYSESDNFTTSAATEAKRGARFLWAIDDAVAPKK